MKEIIKQSTKGLVIATLCIAGQYANAQGFLEKKLAALEASANTTSYSKADLEEAAKDSTNTLLDGKEVMKDSRALSGIYYSKTPIYAMTEGDKPKVLKKFLVNYTETADFNNKIMLSNQYSYETTNYAKYVMPATFVSTTSPPSNGIVTSNKVGCLFLGNSNYEAIKYKFISGNYKKDIQGNYIADGTLKSNWNNSFLEIEPGILLIGSLTVYLDNDGKVKKEEFDLQKRFSELTILYKPGKEALAAKYTREYMWDKLAEFWIKNKEVGDKEGYMFRLSSPSPQGNVPEHQKMKDAAAKLFEEMAAGKGYPIKVLYVYTKQGPFYNAVTSVRAIGGMPVTVPTGRSVDFYVVYENLKPGKMQPNPWFAPNKYGQSVVTVAENMRDDMHSINEFNGRYYLPNFAIPYWLDSTEDPMKFKGK